MKKENRLLFFGELPPNSIQGIAISNHINLEIINSVYLTDIVEEQSRLDEHARLSVKKFLRLSKNIFSVLLRSIQKRYTYFYLVFSLTTFGSIKTLLAILIYRIFNRGKLVLHIHRGDFFKRYYKNKFNRILTKAIFKLSHHIIILSESQKKEFEVAFKRSFLVLSNTIEIEYKPVLKLGNYCNFIFISNYLIDKGIIDLLEVFMDLTKDYNNIRLKTYGAYSDSNLKEKILSYNCLNISINDLICGIPKFKELANSDCLILPSWNEGQPIILLEAMSVGTPVIASRVGLIPELLDPSYPYLMEPGNRDSLKGKIIQFIEQKNAAEVSKNLQERYYGMYSRREHSERLLKIFG